MCEDYQKEVLMTYEGMRPEKFNLLKTDLTSLFPPTHLSEKLFELWLAVIQKERSGFSVPDKIHVFNSEFYRKLAEASSLNSKARLTLMSKWTKDVEIFNKHFLIVPIKSTENWKVAIICHPNGRKLDPKNVGENIRRPCIIYFDGMDEGEVNAVETCDLLIEYLIEEYKVMAGRLSFLKPENFIKIYPKISQQSSSYESGFFALQFVESFFATPILDCELKRAIGESALDLKSWFPHKNAEKKRKEIYNFLTNFIYENYPANYDRISSVFPEDDNVDNSVEGAHPDSFANMLKDITNVLSQEFSQMEDVDDAKHRSSPNSMQISEDDNINDNMMNDDSGDELIAQISSQQYKDTPKMGKYDIKTKRMETAIVDENILNDFFKIEKYVAATKSVSTSSSKNSKKTSNNKVSDAQKRVMQQYFVANRGSSSMTTKRRRIAPIPTRLSSNVRYFSSAIPKLKTAYFYIDNCDQGKIVEMNSKAIKCRATAHWVFLANFDDQRITHFVPCYHRVMGITTSKKLFLAITREIIIVHQSWLNDAFTKGEVAPVEYHLMTQIKITNWPYPFGGFPGHHQVFKGFKIVFVHPFTISDYMFSKDDLIEIVNDAKGNVEELTYEQVAKKYDNPPQVNKLELQKTFVVTTRLNFRQTECDLMFNKLFWITFHPNFILYSIWTGHCCLTSQEVKKFMYTTHLSVDAKLPNK